MGSNILLVSGAHMLGVASYIYTRHNLHQAFQATRDSLTVNLLIEESALEQVYLLARQVEVHLKVMKVILSVNMERT